MLSSIVVSAVLLGQRAKAKNQQQQNSHTHITQREVILKCGIQRETITDEIVIVA